MIVVNMGMSVKRQINDWAVAPVTWLFLIASTIVSPQRAEAQLPPVIDLQEETADVTVYGARSSDRAGFEIASGDFNGDKARDWVIFSVGASPLGRQGVGIIDILWGGTALDSTIDLGSPTIGISRVIPAAGNAGVFASLASGDFNGDGYDDIALGVNCNTTFTNCRGKAYIVFGMSSFPDTLDIDDPSHAVTTIIGASNGENLGLTLTAGDVNGDNLMDLVVAAPGTVSGGGGRIYIVYGRDDFPPIIALAATQSDLTRIFDPGIGWGSGLALDCADLGKDGFSDVLIGSPGNVPGKARGKATIVHGAPNLPDTIFLVEDSPVAMTRIYSDASAGARLGSSVAFGDVNGDGNLDIAVAAPVMNFPPSCYECGEIFVIYGSASLPDSIHVNAPDIPMTRIIGSGPFQTSGFEMASRDITGDHYDELVISNGTDIIPDDVFDVIVVYGSEDLPDSIFLATDTQVTHIYGESWGDYFGIALGADDLNGDGVFDLYVGAMLADPLGRDRAGKVYLFYGANVSGPPPILLEIDIQPGSCPNPLNASSVPPNSMAMKGSLLAVAVLGSERLNVADINISSLRLEDVPPARYDFHDVAAPSESDQECACPTAARDGREDLILQFRKAELIDSIGPVDTVDVIELTLTGLLNDGTPLRGTDCVTIVGLPTDPSSAGELGGVVLRKPMPNPFNPTTRISYSLPTQGFVVLSIYDVAGRLVGNLVNQVQPAGEHAVEWDATAMSSGIYFCRIRVGDFAETHKLVLLK